MLQCRSGWLSCSILCQRVVSFFLHIHLYHLHFSKACTGKYFNYQNGADLDLHDTRGTNYRWMFFFGQPEMKLGCGKFFCFILIEAKALGLLMLGFGKIEVSRVRGNKTPKIMSRPTGSLCNTSSEEKRHNTRRGNTMSYSFVRRHALNNHAVNTANIRLFLTVFNVF